MLAAPPTRYARSGEARIAFQVIGDGPPGDERRAQILDLIENHWGEGRFTQLYAPERARDERFADWWARFERACVSPLMARRLLDLNAQADVTGVLPAIRVPTLVLIRRDNPLVPVAAARAAASLIPDERVVEADGADLYNWPGADDPEMDLIEELLTGRRPQRSAERVLATVLFTDIVGSTEHAARIGDRAWRDVLDRHHAIVRELLDRFRGREIKTLGDGFVATFDRPAAAVRCAQEIVEQVDAVGLSVRCGLHTGECELLDGDVGGIAVHISARVIALAGGGEVVASSTVKDLVVGSDLDFDERGTHKLRGVPGEWRLYAVSD